jgi:hypothetical protein
MTMTVAAPRFITVTTKDVSDKTGKPKLYCINVAHIITVEPVLFDIAVSMDEAYTVEGCTLIVLVSHGGPPLEIDTRDPFDHVMFRISQAGGIVDVTEVKS